MKLNILNAKIKRNNLEEYAGEYFRDNNSQIVLDMKKSGDDALFGIEKENGVYTIIGEKYAYFSTPLGKNQKISLERFSKFLHSNAMNKGKKARYEFLDFENEHEVWVLNINVMSAFLNIILWLENK